MNGTQPQPTKSMAPFFVIWTGQAFSLIGSNVAQFALVWWLTQLTGSATVLATAMMMVMLPQVFLGPIAGFMNPITNGPIFAMLQATVAPEMQGRVFMVVGSLTAAISPLSLAVAGPVADAVGIRIWYVVGGVLCVVMGVSAFFVPAIVNLEQNHRGRAVEGEPPAPPLTEAIAVD